MISWRSFGRKLACPLARWAYPIERDSELPLRDAAQIPEIVGGYRILSILGSGGWGVVYEAEQKEPRRRVGLKVLRPGSVSESA